MWELILEVLSFQRMLQEAIPPRTMCVPTKLLDKFSYYYFWGSKTETTDRNWRNFLSVFDDGSRNLTQNLAEKDTFGVVHAGFSVKLGAAERTRSIKFKQEPTVSYCRSPHLSNSVIQSENNFLTQQDNFLHIVSMTSFWCSEKDLEVKRINKFFFFLPIKEIQLLRSDFHAFRHKWAFWWKENIS